MRTVIFAAITIAACKASPGRQLAVVPEVPDELRVTSSDLVILTKDPEWLHQSDAGTTMRDVIRTVPLSGGAVREVGRPPMGTLRSSGSGILYVTHDGVVTALEGEHWRQITRIAKTQYGGEPLNAPVWAGPSTILGVTHDPDRQPAVSRVVRIDAQTGAVTPLEPTFSHLVWVAQGVAEGDDAYFVDMSGGQTLHVQPDRVEPVAGPTEWVDCVAAVGDRLWWIQRKDPTVENANPHVTQHAHADTPNDYQLMWTGRNGGTATAVATFTGHFAECARSRDELVFHVDRRIMAIKGDERPHTVLVASDKIEAFAVDEHSVYWAQPLDDAGPRGHWSIRVAPLH